MRCISCGEEILPGQNFCRLCGTPAAGGSMPDGKTAEAAQTDAAPGTIEAATTETHDSAAHGGAQEGSTPEINAVHESEDAAGRYSEAEYFPPPPPPDAPAEKARREFPEWLSMGALTAGALAAGIALDVFMRHQTRGLNILFMWAAVVALWAVPLRGRFMSAGSIFTGILATVLSAAMFMQSSGPVDRVLIPLWIAVLLWFGAEMRKAAFDGAGVPVHTIVARTASVLRVCADRVQVFLSLAAGRTAARQVGIGLLVALPIIIVMCILFAEADAAFEKAISNVLENLPDVLEHILWCILFGIMFFVWAGSMLLKGDEGAAPRETSGGLPLLSSMVVLSCVAALVFAFLCVHLRTLLMDHSLLMEYIHMNYSAYIRRGFAELLAAEIIIGFVLLYVLHTAAWVQASEFKHRMVAWLLLLLTLLLSVSCGIRLYYYVLDAGLTLVRTLNSVGIGLSLVCIVYFSIRVVSPVHSSVAAGHIAKMFIVAYVVWACCLPVRSICMFNTWWFQNNPQSIDLTYMRYLGPDTYPYIIEVITKPGFEDEGMDWWLWARNEEFRFEKLSWTEWSPTSDAAHDALKYYTGRK